MSVFIRIKAHQRGLHFRNGELRAVLPPGTHRFWSRIWRCPWDALRGAERERVDVLAALEPRIQHADLPALLESEVFRGAVTVLDLADEERAIVWKDGRVAGILGPGRHALWNAGDRQRVERFDCTGLRFEHPKLEAILAHPDAPRHLDGVVVDAHENVLLFRNGRLVERLGEGKHAMWRGAGTVTWKAIDRREQVTDISGQEILSADKVTLRINLVVGSRVVDPVAAVERVADHAVALHREAQLALRAAVGGRTLDALLADKESVGGEIRATLAPRAAEFGVEVRSVGLRDIILPGEIRDILNRVIQAEKEAQANLIRRREETAAARSQANTAKLLAENPALARLRELEVLQEILAGAKTSFVFGQGDALSQLRAFVGRAEAG